MKKNALLIITCLITGLSACKVDNTDVRDHSIVGKWQETKLELHQLTGANTVKDTVFEGASLTKDDYFQFNSDNTAVISKSGDFSFAGKSIVITANKLFDWVTHYNYNKQDSLVTLVQTDVIPQPLGGPSTFIESVVQLDAGHLILHLNTMPPNALSYPSGLTTTVYFTKEK